MTPGKTILSSQLMDHNRPVTPKDQAILRLMHDRHEDLVLAPVFFNGESRLAVALLEENESGSYLRILAVMVDQPDSVQDKLGNPASFTPPQEQGSLN